MLEQPISSDPIDGGETLLPEKPLLAGRYQVVRPLGTGGMGSVWLVEDRQLDNKLFAIKMLPSILVANKRAYRQLKDEALVAMKLVHPNIVQIRAFEENDGNPFLVMDYIEGQTLDDCLADKGKLSEGETMRLLKPIAAALDYAHGEGVVHRDVKPANVMIRKDGHPFILDFGIAREIQETLTRVTGKLSSGTLLYMSPEQLRGEMPKPAQDIYSFAAMVYECLKGEPPFARGQVEYQILNERPAPLPDGVRLAASIMSGLSKAPEGRPDSCIKVLIAVSAISLASPARLLSSTQPRRPATPTVGRIVVRRKRNIAGIVVPLVVLVAALLALGGVLWHRGAQRRELSRKNAIAAQQAAALLQEEERAKRAEEAARKKADAERKADEERRTKEEAERKRNAEATKRLAAERKAKDSATAIRIEAKVQQGKVARISDADGFKMRKDQLEDVFIRAEAFYDDRARRWAEAEALYRDYVEKSKSLISIDGERQQTVAKRSAVQASFKKAEEAGAKTYARENWNSAVKTWNEAVGEFGRGEFAAATEIFAKALHEFDECAEEAQNNKRIADEKLAEEKRLAEARAAEERRREELARQAEEQRRQEERRKAMQSLPGKWACSTTYTAWYDNSRESLALKYEIEFMRNGNYVKRQVQDDSLITTSFGSWTQSGNRLTMRQSSYNVQFQGKTYSYNTPNENEYEIRWRADGTFEIRYDIGSKRKVARSNLKDYDCYYDEDGTFVSRWTMKQLFTTYNRKDTETAKIFRRISN